MKTTTRISLAIIVVLSLSCTILGLFCAQRYRDAVAREARERTLRQELRTLDALEDDAAAVDGYRKLTPLLPEVQLRIVQRQWRMALEQLNYLRRSRANTELRDGREAAGARLKKLLDEMTGRCGELLADSASLRPDILWRLYNTAGAAKVLSALVMLESEQNADKIQGVMRDALSDFKAAIEAVDRAGVDPMYRNIPRWNFEVLNGEENVQTFQPSMGDAEKNQALKENLETMLPEIGGYAPGEPMDTRVKK